ncbi:MAG: energy-coupling factor transporter transmembrane protein EcfT [Oscillospiraceae bacterium]|nr:energy-coupling factor transporter transmembrane protein EcfT [Oscillospiraceae bacterium]
MKKSLHILTPVFLLALSLFFLFSSDHPFAICGSLLFSVLLLAGGKGRKKLRQGLWFALPMTLFILLFNLVFVSSGVTELAVVFGKRVTLESILYAVFMGAKLLAAAYLFFAVGSLVDGDRAVSYFGSRLPKSTLTFLLIFRLIPRFIESFFHLKEVYTTRGVEFDEAPFREKVKSYRIVLSVLLEQSLESSFEIGEAAYTRGFLSTKRSVYERGRPALQDWLVFSAALLLLAVYILLLIRGSISFNLYFGDGLERLSDPLWMLYLVLCTAPAVLILLTGRKPRESSEVLWDI